MAIKEHPHTWRVETFEAPNAVDPTKPTHCEARAVCTAPDCDAVADFAEMERRLNQHERIVPF